MYILKCYSYVSDLKSKYLCLAKIKSLCFRLNFGSLVNSKKF
jgi:hypothetical protein